MKQRKKYFFRKDFSAQSPAGFTLIELLVVIALIAVLAVVVLLDLNPAELLRRSRDSTRLSDIATLKNAVSLYLTDVSKPNLASSSVANPFQTVFITGATTSTVTTDGWGVSAIYTTSTGSASANIDSTGWLPVNFMEITSGVPISSLPIDPMNDGVHFYGYVATNSNSFKLTAHTESRGYSAGGSNDVEGTDGGLSTSTYEDGTNLNL